MKLIRKIKFQNRVNLMIIDLMEEEMKAFINLNEQKELSDIGIDSQVDKYKNLLSTIRSQIIQMERLERIGPKDPFARTSNGKLLDAPCNWVNMSLVEMLMCHMQNGGIKSAIEKMGMSGIIYGHDVGAIISMIFLSLTSPLWIWFPLYNERKLWRDRVAEEQVRFKIGKNK